MPPRPAIKRRKLASDSEDYSPTKRPKNSVPRYLTRNSTRRTRSQSNRPYTRDPNNSDDSDGLVTTAVGGRNNSGMLKIDMLMSGALGRDPRGDQDPKWKSKSKIASESTSTASVENSSTVSEVNGETSQQDQQPEPQVSASQSSVQDAEDTPKANGNRKSLEDGQSQGEIDSESGGNDSTDSRSAMRHMSNTSHIPRRLSDLVESNETGLSLPDDDLDDFQPADESTPFILSKSTRALAATVSSSSPNSPTPKRPRMNKLSSPRVQVPRSPLAVAVETPPHSSPPELEDSQEQEIDHGTQISEAELLSFPPVQRQTTPAGVPSWMAPPASSSSPLKSPQAKKSNGSVPTKPNSPKSLSTAALQSLLPKRRPRPRKATPDEYDIPDEDSGDASGENASEEDELSYLPARKPAKNITKATKKSLLNATNGKANAKATKKKSTGPPKRPQTTKASKSKQPAKVTPAKVTDTILASTSTITTSLDRPPSASSNKENRTKPLTSSPLSTPSASTPQSAEPDASSSGPVPLPKPVAKDRAIKTLAKKFKEVDEWSLDFEDGSLEHSSDRGKR